MEGEIEFQVNQEYNEQMKYNATIHPFNINEQDY